MKCLIFVFNKILCFPLYNLISLEDFQYIPFFMYILVPKIFVKSFYADLQISSPTLTFDFFNDNVYAKLLVVTWTRVIDFKF